MTGGSLESDRCKRLTQELGVDVRFPLCLASLMAMHELSRLTAIPAQIGEHQIVQSHTIFRSLVPRYADKPVLVVGGVRDSCRRVAEA